MNIGDIKQATAAYLQVPLVETVVNGYDLLLHALNSARKHAESIHDWQCQKVTCSTTTTLGSGAWASMTDLETDLSVRLKQPDTFLWSTTDGRLIPLKHSSVKLGAQRLQEFNSKSMLYDRDRRYLSDDATSLLSRNMALGSNGYEVFMGNTGTFKIEPVPTENLTIVVEGYRWLDDYATDEDEDFFTQDGHEYLMMYAIVQLNLRFQTFVPQTEGNLAPPEKARDNALGALIEHDNFVVEGGRLPSR